jgi:putative glutamine amidotransferase
MRFAISTAISFIFILSLKINTAQAFPVKIGVSKISKNYAAWLLQSDSTVILVDLYTLPVDSAITTLSQCDGLLLTGGEDVYPGWYGKLADTIRCTEMNRRRDTLDLALIRKALELQMPVFAVCRGHQILNVALGGTLIIDIPQDYKSSILHQCDDYLHCFHPVSVNPYTRLSEISHCRADTVTTNHHQAIGKLSHLLIANAHSPDGLIEGMEWASSEAKSFLIGVQWHPERMDKMNGLSGNLADEFIRQAKLFQNRTEKI